MPRPRQPDHSSRGPARDQGTDPADRPLEFLVHQTMRLDAALLEWLDQDFSRSRVRSLVMKGAVRVDGRPVFRPTWILVAGSRVQVQIPSEAPQGVAEFGPERIVFEDDDLLVVDKPVGLAMHANLDPDRPHLVGLVEAFLTRRDGQKGYLGLHQRLDLDTSGVLLFSRSQRANPSLARQFEAGRVGKTYLALTARPTRKPPETWLETRPLGEPTRKGGPMRVLPPGPEGTAARTEFTVASESSSGLLIQARPQTGRKHQIRAHLAVAGLPILGDILYGGRRRLGGLEIRRPMLHAWCLHLVHPMTGAPLDLRAAPPADFDRLRRLLALVLPPGEPAPETGRE